MTSLDFDFIVIGSGFGGSVTAHRLTEKGYRVAVMEMGRRWTRGEPSAHQLEHLALDLAARTRRCAASSISSPSVTSVILHGCAVGGGSITYANTLLVPRDAIWENGSWAGLADWKAEMPAALRDRLANARGGREPRARPGGPDPQAGGRCAVGVGDTFYRTHVAVFEPPEGEADGETIPILTSAAKVPSARTCIGCGGCMMGCRYNAKNTLDKNYLYLAEKHGARVFAGNPRGGCPASGRQAGRQRRVRGADREVHRLAAQGARRFTCRGVVFAASALGTMDLLFRLKQRGSLPAISDRLGSACAPMPNR